MKKEETRKLNKAEQRRLDAFNQEKQELESLGYKAVDLTASGVKANMIGPLYGLLLSIPFIVLFMIFGNMNSYQVGDNYFANYTVFLILVFVFIVIHELLHGLGWSLSTKNGFKSIEFGVIWKTLNPYCTCGESLNRKQYCIGLLLPCLVLGFIPCIISIFNHNMWYLVMGIIMLVSAGGDLLIFKMILDYKSDKETLYHDHPTDIGLVCFEKQ